MHSNQGSSGGGETEAGYSKAAVPDQIEQQHRQKIRQTVAEVEGLLQECRALLGTETHQREHAKLVLIKAWETDDDLGVRALEASYKALLNQRDRLVEVLRVSFGG